MLFTGLIMFFYQMDLPNSQDMFFTSQIVSGGEIFIAYDNALRQYWPIVVNQVYIPAKVCFYKMHSGYLKSSSLALRLKFLYTNHLNARLVWYSNDRFVSGC